MFDPENIIKNASVDFDFDSIEPKEECNHYYDASRHLLAKLDEIIYVTLQKQPKNTLIWGLAFAIGSKHLEGRSMTDVAKTLNLSRAAISKQATYICKSLNLPASAYMSPARKRPGKETEEKRALRLVNSLDMNEEVPELLHEKIVQVFYDKLDKHIDKFYDKNNPVNPVFPQGEVFGKIYRNHDYSTGERTYTTIKEVFIKNEKLLKFFDNCAPKTPTILFALKRAGVLKASKTSRWIIDYPQYGCIVEY